MPTVYLPMGYPVQTGQQFDLIVFQGNLVRSYTLPKDPRSDSALFQRRFLSDVSKMRSFLGEVVRAGLIEALGTTWSTVLFQIIKSDSFGWWSGATAIWDAAGEEVQQTWRDAAPYKVTFNDMGWIFFALCRVMYEAINYYAVGLYYSEVWSINDAAGALAWYTKTRTGTLMNLDVIWDNALIKYHGSWSVGTVQYYTEQLQIKRSSGSPEDWLEILFFGKLCTLWSYKDPTYGMGEAFINGVSNGQVNFQGTNDAVYSVFESTKRRVRSFVIKPVGNSIIALYAAASTGGT